MSSSSVAINDKVFFQFADRALAACNYQTHEQFVLSNDHLHVLLAVAAGENINCTKALEELKKSNILTDRTAATDDVVCEKAASAMPEDAFSFEKGHEAQKLKNNWRKTAPVNLFDVLRDRMSARNFSNASVPLSSISTILTETFAYRDHPHCNHRPTDFDALTKRRSSASGGSLQCSEAYLIAKKVRGLIPGVYHYRSHSDSLALLNPVSQCLKFGTEYLAGQSFSDDADAFVVITSRLGKMWWKFKHSRAYRVACFDVGHLSQTAQLIATGLQLRTWVTAAFFDDRLRDLLAIGPNEAEFPMLVLGFGSGESNPIGRPQRPPAI